MSDVDGVNDGQRDWFVELTTRIPAFSGYREREQRRTADKTIRDTMAAKLDELRSILAEVMEQANEAETSVLDDISKILHTLNDLRDRVEFLGYGETSFFSEELLDESALPPIYELETQTYDKLDDLETVFESPKDLGRRDTLKSIRRKLEEITKDFAARKEAIKRVQKRSGI
ncbi:MAG: hypothetical protein Q7V53_01690 [Caldisericota bacterium]|jgi:hypothetical protein|nr:hypothetical protein [Caldisericota bacterium]